MSHTSCSRRHSDTCLRPVVQTSWWLLATSVALVLVFAEARAEQRPNILLILIDDLGWMDLRCQGNAAFETPRIDQLAEGGIRFTDAYAAAPVCSPTRAALLTGLAPARLKITNHIPDQKRFIPEDADWLPALMQNQLDAKYTTVAELLKKAGYATAFFGKWHLAGGSKKEGLGDVACYPEAQGFDENVGGCAYGGPPTFFDPYRIHNLPPRRTGEYLPDRLADETIRYIREHKDKPFFVALWNYTVHWPMEAPAVLLEKYRKRPGLKDHRYAAMVEAMDSALGRIFDALDGQGIAENTLVIFTSDNGAFGGVSDCKPLRASKGYLYEGGIRVPLIIRWPVVVKPKQVSAQPTVTMDFFPTLLEAAGVSSEAVAKLPEVDGVSLMPLLRQGEALNREAIYFHYPNYAWHRKNRLGGAVREGRFKLIEWFDDGSLELYDLEADIGESRNLAATMPKKAQALQAKLAAWRRECDAAMPRRREP